MISFDDFIAENGIPIYLQVVRHIKRQIASGAAKDGDEMISRRTLSALLGVNPNTVQKSFEELERRGVIHSVRCSGWFVNDNTESAINEVESYRLKKTEEYLVQMAQLGCNQADVLKYLNQIKEEKHE